MKILYGVTGEGMGHAMRSRVLIDHLVSRGHDVAVVASGRAYAFLRARFPDVRAIHGLHMIFDGNRLDLPRTLLSNALGGLRGIPTNVAAHVDLLERFRPEVVISDFDSWSWLYGMMHRLPILSVDNMQLLDRCELPDALKEGSWAEFHMTRAFVKSKLPGCDRYFVTSFVRPPTRKPRTQLFPPILRPEILAVRSRPGTHVLVYPPAGDHPELLASLRRLGIECRVYGRGDITQPQVHGNVRELPFDEATFIDDLASCRAVIAGGGFTLMGEALHLGKPMLSLPIAGQYEQVLNARCLELEGYGSMAESADAATIQRFMDSLPRFTHHLATYPGRDNRAIERAVEGWLDDVRDTSLERLAV